MTRKDYVLIAAALARSQPIPIGKPDADSMRNSVFEMCVRNLADDLSRDNARFDRERFLQACGVQS